VQQGCSGLLRGVRVSRIPIRGRRRGKSELHSETSLSGGRGAGPPSFGARLLSAKDDFFRPDEEITHVYFIEQGCSSLINILPDGNAVEVGTIGNEGLVGTPILMESDKMPLQCDMEIPGHGWRMPAHALKAAVHRNDTLRIKLLRFAQGHFNQVAQTAACNRLHTIEERCARWLLMTRDRVGDEFPLTQEYLAMMLGVRRAGVTVTANILQKAGFIR
jgi:CRP-like cAMP-binding protein